MISHPIDQSLNQGIGLGVEAGIAGFSDGMPVFCALR